MTTTHPADTDVAAALSVARNLARHGIPVLVAYPDRDESGQWRPDGGHNGTGYWLREGWQTSAANPTYVDAWRPGCALIAVMGHGLDLLDVDPRNDGDLSRTALMEADMWPRAYAAADTPSGGTHEFVASLGVRGRDGVRPGLDVKAGTDGAGHGFAFIAPTVKLSKTTGELVAYRWTTPPDLAALAEGDNTGQALAELVARAHGSRAERAAGVVDEEGESPDWVAALTSDTIPKGTRYPRLRSLAGWCRHHGIAIDDARALVKATWQRCDQPADDPMPWSDALALVDDIYTRYGSGQVDLTSWLPDQAEPGGEQGGRRITLTPASTITPRPVRWSWTDRLPMGEVCLTPGRGGVGKSTFHAWAVAHLTRGTLPGAHYGNPRACIIAASEDSWARTIVPRLIAADADLDLVFRADVVTEEGAELALSLPADCDLLAAELARVDAVLLSLDPLMSTINGSLDTHKDRDVRTALEPLARLADRTGVTVLGNAHFNKGAGNDPLSLIMGSAAFGNVVRAALAFARDEDAADGTCVISQVKNNLGRVDLPSLQYRIDPAAVATDEGAAEVGKLTMLGESTRSVADLLRDRGASREDRSDIDEAGEWLTMFLTEVGTGYAPAVEVLAAGQAAGFAKHTLQRVRKRIGVRTRKAGMGGGWVWELPGEGDDRPEGDSEGDEGDPSQCQSPSSPSSHLRGDSGDPHDCPSCGHPLDRPPPGRCSADAWHGQEALR